MTTPKIATYESLSANYYTAHSDGNHCVWGVDQIVCDVLGELARTRGTAPVDLAEIESALPFDADLNARVMREIAREMGKGKRI